MGKARKIVKAVSLFVAKQLAIYQAALCFLGLRTCKTCRELHHAKRARS